MARHQGFTLLEVMVVVVIVGVLAVIAVVSYKGYMRKARMQEGIAFLMDLKLKQEAYFSAYSQYVDTGVSDKDFYPPRSVFKPEKLPVGWGTWDCASPANNAVRGFCALGYSAPPSPETFFKYVTIGWAPGDPPPSTEYISDSSRRWWFARAITYYDPKGDLVLELRFSSELTQVIELWPDEDE